MQVMTLEMCDLVGAGATVKPYAEACLVMGGAAGAVGSLTGPVGGAIGAVGGCAVGVAILYFVQ